MTNHPIDEAAERREFERIISAPPYEHMCDTNGRSSAWLGQYKRYETQLAWELWLARARIAAEREAELVKDAERLQWIAQNAELVESEGTPGKEKHNLRRLRKIVDAALAPESGR